MILSNTVFGGTNMNYTGIKCPVCDKAFQPDDDIVVCPECGAPYHRECYHQAGKCKFDDLHEAGKHWTPPEAPKKPDVSAEIKDQECPSCGKLNAHSALFCDQCGASLSGQPAQHHNRTNTPPPPADQNPYSRPQDNGPFPGGSPFPGGGMGGAPMPFALDPMGGVDANELIDDVPAGEMAKLVHTNTAYYMPVFRNMKVYKKNRFNFCAFLFSGGWMLYRKQYKWGSIITALMFALYIGYTYCNIAFTFPLLQNLMIQVGVEQNSTGLTNQQLQAMVDLLMQKPSQLLIVLLPYAFLGLMLAIMIFVGLRGNRMYMNHCLHTVHKLRSENVPAAEYNVQLQARGNVNTPITICLLVCYLIITWLPRFF